MLFKRERKKEKQQLPIAEYSRGTLRQVCAGDCNESYSDILSIKYIH